MVYTSSQFHRTSDEMPSTTATSLLDTIQDGTSPKNSQLRTGILRLLAAVWIQQHFIREFFGIRIQPAIDPVDHDMVLKRAVWKALHRRSPMPRSTLSARSLPYISVM